MKNIFRRHLLPAALWFLLCGCFCFKNNTPPELEQLGFKARSKMPGVFFHPRTGSVLKLAADTRICFINGMQFFLPHAVTVDDEGRFRVSELSIQKVIRPLFSEKTDNPRCIRTVLLDAGHGDHNLGAVGKKYREKDLNLSLTRKTAAALKKRGFNVKLTRADDRFLTLAERGKMARYKNADLFLSIHHNASGNPESCGVETYIVTPRGSASSNDKAHEIHRAAVPGNQHDVVNIRLAAELQKSLLKHTGRADRGVRFARFKVLALSQLPGALIEAGYISHEKEELLCGKESEQNKTAEAIAEAVSRLNQRSQRSN
ncbi:MAG: N-acetylmuramoyl-L-alanine amidase [Lentisphaeria bacterium]|nr:N-acetylmuramoyl-L-alanine amidase [Lentisphaeria bacterium]